jgi:hypothetical protein
MQKLIPLQLMIFLIQIICILGLARLFGELVKKFDLPVVLGELLAGVILGPTVFGTLAPDFFASLFHLPIDAGLALDGRLFCKSNAARINGGRSWYCGARRYGNYSRNDCIRG